MKSFIVFIVSLLVGGGLAFGLFVYNKSHQNIIPSSLLPFSPTSSSQFSLENAPRASLKGMIESMEGDVLWQSRVATEPAKLFAPKQIQQGEDLVTSDSGKMVVKFDTTNIEMTKNSKVSFIQTFPKSFVVSQPKGIVTYTKNDSEPLSIRSMSLLIQMNEGKITANVDDSERTITITVKNGPITVAYNDLNNLTIKDHVSEGNKYMFDNNSRTSRVVVSNE